MPEFRPRLPSPLAPLSSEHHRDRDQLQAMDPSAAVLPFSQWKSLATVAVEQVIIKTQTVQPIDLRAPPGPIIKLQSRAMDPSAADV